MAYINCVSSYFPKNTLSNEMLLQQFPDWTLDKIYKKIGIKNRHLANDESVSSMAISASKKLFSLFNVNPRDIDFILLCTQSPDYILPTTACIVQKELFIPTTAGALDFNLGCSGYVYGLALAKGLISSNIAKNVLLITSETYSKHLHPLDKSNRAIFGDAATASLISTKSGYEIGEFVLGTDGTGFQNLIIKNGGSLNKKMNDYHEIDYSGKLISDDHLFMNGSEIFNFTMNSIPSLIVEVLKKNNLSHTEIDSYVFHQANLFMLEHLRDKMKIPSSKFPIMIENCGNTVSSTIPLVLEQYFLLTEYENINRILLSGFGVGYSWGAVTLKKSN